MVEVSESVSQPTDFLDDQVDRLGAAVGDAVGVEVGQHLLLPGLEGAAQTGNLGDRAAGEAVEYFGGDLAAFGRGGVVDGTELLVALPGQVHLLGRIAGVEAGDDLGLLLVGEVFDAVAEQPTDLVERVLFMTTSAEGVLLDAAAHLVDNLAAQPDHMKRIQHSDGVGQSVVDRVGIPAEGVERSSLNAVDELVGLVAEPSLVDASGAADDGVQEPGVQASGLVRREINHDGDGPVDPDPRRPPVGSGCGALSRLPVVVFHSPPAEPGVRFSPHRALHVSRLVSRYRRPVWGSTGSVSGSRGSGTESRRRWRRR